MAQTLVRATFGDSSPSFMQLPLEMDEDAEDTATANILALQLLSQAAEESPRERCVETTNPKRGRDMGAISDTTGSPRKRPNSPRLGPASPRLSGMSALQLSPHITKGSPRGLIGDPGTKKPRWVDVIAVAMQQLAEQTHRRSFKVAEVADQIAAPVLVADQRPAIDACWLTENWRGALNSYFTNSKRFAPDLSKKKHWVLQLAALNASPSPSPSFTRPPPLSGKLLKDDPFRLDGGSQDGGPQAALESLAGSCPKGSRPKLLRSLGGGSMPSLAQAKDRSTKLGSARTAKMQQSACSNGSVDLGSTVRNIPKPKHSRHKSAAESSKPKGKSLDGKDANRKPRWVDVIAVAMHQLMEGTGRRSFKVAEVADQIARPIANTAKDGGPPLSQPAVEFGMLTENWRGALNSYFTKSNKFSPDPERKSHWILQTADEAQRAEAEPEHSTNHSQVLQLLDTCLSEALQPEATHTATTHMARSPPARPAASGFSVAATGSMTGVHHDQHQPMAEREILRKLMESALQVTEHGRPVFNNSVATAFPELWDDYRSVIQTPMDLGTVQRRLEAGHYTTIQRWPSQVPSQVPSEVGIKPALDRSFVADVRLVWSNAMQYNEVESVWARQAQQMAQYFEGLLQQCATLANQQQQAASTVATQLGGSAAGEYTSSGSGSECSSPMALEEGGLGGSDALRTQWDYPKPDQATGPLAVAVAAAATAAATAAQAVAAAGGGIAPQPAPQELQPQEREGCGQPETAEVLEASLQHCRTERERLGAEHQTRQRQFAAAVEVLERQRQQASVAYTHRLAELERAEAGLWTRQLALASAGGPTAGGSTAGSMPSRGELAQAQCPADGGAFGEDGSEAGAGIHLPSMPATVTSSLLY